MLLSLLSCSKRDDKVVRKAESAELAKLPRHSIIYSGDLTLGRRFNEALLNPKQRRTVFGDVAPLLKQADIALVNAEGVIASGGQFTDRGEHRPYMFRAHPLAVDLLAEAGVDVVTVGNNHTGDYGPAAFTEMLDRLAMADIGYCGGGHDLRDARRPYYQKIGDTVVAIVGADLTVTKMIQAQKDRAGPLFVDFFKKDDVDEAVTELSKILDEARRHAHVVLFTPHWGSNWVARPRAGIRRLARALIRAGYDGIIGHSAHWFQGVELIDGKPVIYDAGNLILDFGGGDDAHRAMLWELTVSRAGVTGIKGYPLWLNKNQATLAKGKRRDEILSELSKRSQDLGTKLKLEHGVAELQCSPDSVSGPAGTPEPPKRGKPEKIRFAPSDMIIDELPADATKVNVEYGEGIRLIGYKLLSEKLRIPKAGQIVILYWQADKKVKDSYRIHLEARGLHLKTGKKRKLYATHVPGDWILPTNEWPVGKVIRDWTLFRLTLKPEGPVDFYTGLLGRRLLKPRSSDLSLVDDRLVPLGSAVYSEGAKKLFEVLKEYRKESTTAE